MEVRAVAKQLQQVASAEFQVSMWTSDLQAGCYDPLWTYKAIYGLLLLTREALLLLAWGVHWGPVLFTFSFPGNPLELVLFFRNTAPTRHRPGPLRAQVRA